MKTGYCYRALDDYIKPHLNMIKCESIDNNRFQETDVRHLSLPHGGHSTAVSKFNSPAKNNK